MYSVTERDDNVAQWRAAKYNRAKFKSDGTKLQFDTGLFFLL